MLTELIIILIGVAAILILAELIICHAIKVANYTGLSGTFIGMTTISGLLIGTNIGSDIFQQNFILPTVGLIGTIMVGAQVSA